MGSSPKQGSSLSSEVAVIYRKGTKATVDHLCQENVLYRIPRSHVASPQHTRWRREFQKNSGPPQPKVGKKWSAQIVQWTNRTNCTRACVCACVCYSRTCACGCLPVPSPRGGTSKEQGPERGRCRDVPEASPTCLYPEAREKDRVRRRRAKRESGQAILAVCILSSHYFYTSLSKVCIVEIKVLILKKRRVHRNPSTQYGLRSDWLTNSTTILG